MRVSVRKSKASASQANSEITFSDVIRGMQHCVDCASQIVERQYLDRINRYFTEDGEPLTYCVRLPDGSRMDVPIFSLMNHSALCLDKVKVKMAVQLQNIDVKSVPIPDNENGIVVERGSFSVDILSAGTGEARMVDLEMTFSASESPEAVLRIVDKLDNALIQYKEGERKEENL